MKRGPERSRRNQDEIMMDDNSSNVIDISIRIGGEAGQGINAISTLLGKAFVRMGLFVFINYDIMSRIRGGHNFSQLRVSNRNIRSVSSGVDILVCLDRNTLEIYRDEISGLTIYDNSQIKDLAVTGEKYLGVPFTDIAVKTGKNPKMANSVASGALSALLGIPPGLLSNIFHEIFNTKGDEIIKANQVSAKAGFDYITEHYKEKIISNIKPDDSGQKRMLIKGSEAIALGAIASNIRFYSAYPMSPSTDIMEYLASKQKELGLIVEQAEDEIAAINMALGAFFCGARAMTGTSGGGLALMVEGISLAGMTETPVVVVDGQRPGPATGFPTRTEQADLLFVIHAGHGESPRVVFAPSTVEEAFFMVSKAFYLAEKYQIPVFILTDQYFNDSLWTAEKFDSNNIYEGRENLMSSDDLKNIPAYGYRRYEITESGISPRILPGTPNQVLYADSDEHAVEGHITESAIVRNQMVEKRLRKFQGIYNEISPPRIYPDNKAGNYIISWGSTLAPVEEAINILRAGGTDIGYIHFSEIYPMRNDVIPQGILQNSRLIGVENNATGQLAKLLKMEAGVEVTDKILKYDGRPFSTEELVEKIKNLR